MRKRDESIDALRWLALTGIILVHSEPSAFWAQLRSFDVPLMVILSAVVFTYGRGRISNWKDYYRKRFVRLILPSWIFLSFYFPISWMVTGECSIKKVLMCFTLTTSWYFWIIRILVVMAFLAPYLIQTKNISKRKLVLICIILLGITELLALISDNYYYVVMVMFIPYTSYYVLGINLNRFSEKEIKIAGVILLSCFAVIAFLLYIQNRDFILTGEHKYPPRFYYTSYALGSSAILWCIKDSIVSVLQALKIKNFAVFVGSHTFWFYLWHIPVVDYMINDIGFVSAKRI